MSKYTYVNLVSASGSVNVVCVVKFVSEPKKTKGSGYSVFISVTDPSLNGGKLPCVLFDDVKENLPPITSPGDIIIMHRLIVKEYQGRNQGCGYGNTGFSAAVFSGDPSDTLDPRLSSKCCHFGETELEKVSELRNWYFSPNCPVEREITHNDNCLPGPSLLPNTLSTKQMATVTHFNYLKSDEFCTIEGQVVSIYFSPDEDDLLILYIWNGPLSDVRCTNRFYGLSLDKMHLLKAQSDQRLAIMTAHFVNKSESIESSFSNSILDRRKRPYSLVNSPSTHLSNLSNRQVQNEDSCLFKDWSVPLFVYDEHALEAKSRSIKPGDCIRVHNVHVVCCRRHECPIPGCLRLVVHGGGQKFNRGIRRLGSKSLVKQFIYNHINNIESVSEDLIEANKNGLLTNLQKGFDMRPPYLKPCSKTVIPPELRNVLNIAQLCNIPLAFTNEERKADEWNLLYTANIPTVPYVSPSHWLKCKNHDVAKKNKVFARLVACVTSVCPSNESSLKEALVLACSDCGTTVKASSLTNNNVVAVIPFIVLKLTDSTGDIVLNVKFPHVVTLFSNILDHESIKQLESMAWWLSLVLPMSEVEQQQPTPRETFLQCMQQLVGQWVDIVVCVNWLKSQTPEKAGEIECLQDIQNLKFNLISWSFLAQD